MGSLSAILSGASSALDAFQYALGVSQNNIGNSSTPGYAKQTVDFQADPFDPSLGVMGGVSRGPLLNSRDLLVERDVWGQASAQGDASARNEALGALQNALPTADGSGIPAALTSFFNEASAWSESPNDGSLRQAVMDSAQTLAGSFQTTAAAVNSASQTISQNIGATVDQINQLTTQLASYNAAAQNGGKQDAGLQAKVYSTLQTLSGLVDISVVPQQDGSIDVTLQGGAALVLGSRQYGLTATAAPAPVQSADPLAAPDVAIQASDGSDITGEITSGTLHGLLQVRNGTIPAIIGDGSQPGALNQLASTLANRVNQIVANGSVSAGVASPGGLFVTDPNHPTTAAATLAVDSKMSAAQLPAIDQNGVSNGVALALAGLANPQQAADEVDSVSYTAFYGNHAAEVGRQLSQAQGDQDLTTQTLAQASSMRQTESGVSLDAEAINVLQFQAGYQAVAKMITTLDTLMQTVINMIPT